MTEPAPQGSELPPPIRVMLVDDQDLLRSGFRLLLMAEPDIAVIAEANSGEAALAELARLRGACDVVLMDVRMPGMSGIDATRRIARDFPDVRVLVLTTFDGDQYVADAVAAGAAGFLLKDATPEDLIRAIHAVQRGDAVMSPAVATRIWQQLRSRALGMAADTADQPGAGAGPRSWAGSAAESAAGSAAESVAGSAAGTAAGSAAPSAPRAGAAAPADADAAQRAALAALTPRERDVLQLIAQGKNNSEIMAELFLSESTVKTHISRVFAKLGLRDRVHAVIFAKDHGL